MSEPTTTIAAHDRYGRPLDVDPSGETVLTGGFDGSVACWTVSDWTETRRFEAHDRSVNCGAMVTADRCITGSTDHTLRVWSLATAGDEPAADGPLDATLETTLGGHGGTVAGVAVDRERQRAASASYDATVRLWDLATGDALAVLEGHPRNVTSVVFGADGRQLVSGGIGDEALVWAPDDTAPVARLPGHGDAVSGLDCGPDGTVWSVGYNETVHSWSLPDGAVRSAHDLPGEATPTGLAIDPAGDRLAVTVDHGCLVLSGDGERLAHYETSIKGISDPRWTPDGQWLLTGGADGAVRVYETPPD